MKTLLFVGILAAGCGSPLGVFESTQNCLGPYRSADYNYTINKSVAAQNELFLKQLFEHPWKQLVPGGQAFIGEWVSHDALIKDDKEFCETFGGIPITVKSTFDFPCQLESGSSECLGETNLNGIALSSSGEALPHELLHVLEISHFIFNTPIHPQWKDKGFYDLSNRLWDGVYNPQILSPIEYVEKEDAAR